MYTNCISNQVIPFLLNCCAWRLTLVYGPLVRWAARSVGWDGSADLKLYLAKAGVSHNLAWFSETRFCNEKFC